MLSIFTSEITSDYRPPVLDPHTTSPGQSETVIVRKETVTVRNARGSEIYDRARQIYNRGRRISLMHGSEIV